MDKILEFIIASLNSKNSLRKNLGWLSQIFIYLRSLNLWIGKVEFHEFKHNLTYARKQSRHPRVGERSVEYPWVHKKLKWVTKKKILDVGCKEGLPITDILRKENIVYGIDPNIDTQITQENLLIFPGDIRETNLPENSVDVVVAVSTLEHIGVAGRYGVTKSDDLGDLNAAREIHRILKPEGFFCGTVPFGKGKSLPLNRLYDGARLHRLLDGYELIDLTYYKYYENYELWLEVDEKIAEMTDWDKEPWYSLACFYVKKKI